MKGSMKYFLSYKVVIRFKCENIYKSTFIFINCDRWILLEIENYDVSKMTLGKNDQAKMEGISNINKPAKMKLAMFP